MAAKSFNLLTSTAHDIQQLFDRSELNAESLVNQVLDQISKHNRDGLNLGALISVAPRQELLKRARFLDQERATGKARSPLHGIPFIVKVHNLLQSTYPFVLISPLGCDRDGSSARHGHNGRKLGSCWLSATWKRPYSAEGTYLKLLLSLQYLKGN
jgi:hypothetical protein